MQVNDVVFEPEKEAQKGSAVFRTVDFVRFGLSVARDIDNCARNLPPAQEITNRDEIALHPAVRRRIGTELQHSH